MHKEGQEKDDEEKADVKAEQQMGVKRVEEEEEEKKYEEEEEDVISGGCRQWRVGVASWKEASKHPVFPSCPVILPFIALFLFVILSSTSCHFVFSFYCFHSFFPFHVILLFSLFFPFCP